jgi:hypothetical protein
LRQNKPGIVDKFLGDSSPSHLVLDVAEGRVVLTEVVRHVTVGVDAQQLGTGVNEELDEVQVAASRGGMLKTRQI